MSFIQRTSRNTSRYVIMDSMLLVIHLLCMYSMLELRHSCRVIASYRQLWVDCLVCLKCTLKRKWNGLLLCLPQFLSIAISRKLKLASKFKANDALRKDEDDETSLATVGLLSTLSENVLYKMYMMNIPIFTEQSISTSSVQQKPKY